MSGYQVPAIMCDCCDDVAYGEVGDTIQSLRAVLKGEGWSSEARGSKPRDKHACDALFDVCVDC